MPPWHESPADPSRQEPLLDSDLGSPSPKAPRGMVSSVSQAIFLVVYGWFGNIMCSKWDRFQLWLLQEKMELTKLEYYIANDQCEFKPINLWIHTDQAFGQSAL